MSSKQDGGFTLIEMIVAIVIISVGLAGVLLAFNTVVRSSADPLIDKQMLAVAEEMMEEVMLKPYAIGPGVRVGCDRSAADDITDYDTYSEATCTLDGTPMGPPLDGYVTTVAVKPTTFNGIPDASAAGATASLVTVTVTHGGKSVSLNGWRANYAAELQ